MSIVTFLEGSPCLALRTTSSFPCSPAPFTWQPTKACSDKTKAPGTGRSRRRLDGFSVAGPGHFYASGHPGDGVDLPAPVGLMETTNAGKTWKVRSLGGESDFHALTSSSKGVLGYDGALRSTADGKTWTKLAISAEPTRLGMISYAVFC